jgi:hypothetical protein
MSHPVIGVKVFAVAGAAAGMNARIRVIASAKDIIRFFIRASS